MLEVQPRTFSLFGMTINNDSLTEAADKVLHPNAGKKARTVSFVNVNTVNLSVTDPSLAESVNDSDLVFADGAGMRIAATRQGISMRDNVNGTDLLPLICEGAAQEGIPMFFLGAAPGVAAKAAMNLEKQYPGLDIVGVHHGFFDKQSNQQVIDCINRSGAKILFVAFGSPIQEQWVMKHRDALKVETVLAVGGLFDFYSGRIPRAPLWMRRNSLEWLFRLIQEPRTKFQRYVIGNPIFLWRCFWQLEKQY